MKITKLNIKNFKRFTDETFEFTEDLNVIQGLNEAGKSTISEAIMVLLFSDPATKSKQFLDTYLPWSGSGHIYLYAEGTAESGKFSLTKDFGLKTVILKNLDTGKEARDLVSVQKSMGQLLGIDSQRVYEATAFVRQNDLAKIDSTTDLASAVQDAASLSGAEGSVQNVLKQLDRDILELKKGLDRPTKNPGKIRELMDELTKANSDLTAAKEKWEKVKSAAKTGKTSEQDVAQIRKNIELLEAGIENNKKFKEASEKIKEVDKRIFIAEKELKQVSDIDEQIDKAKQDMKKFGEFANLDLQKIQEEISLIGSDIKSNEMTMDRLGKLIEKSEPSPVERKTAIPIVIPIAVATVSLGIYLLTSLLPILLTGVGIALVLVIYTFIQRKPEQSTTGKKELREDEHTKLKNEIESNKQKLAQILQKAGAKSTDEFFTKKAQLVTYKEILLKLEERKKGMLADKSIEDIKNEQAELFVKKKEIETNEFTDDIKNAELSPDEYLMKRRELDTLKMKERSLSKVEAESKVRAQDADVSRDQLIRLEETVEKIDKDLKFNQRKLTIVELVKSTIEKAIGETAKNAGKVIGTYVNKFLPIITNGKYTQARVRDDLGIEIFSDEKNEWIDPKGSLSTGTVDQIFFITRLAILDLVAKDTHPPIILDDPFVTFDDPRKQSTRKMLEETAKKHQIILLTHHKEYGDWGELNRL